jgi:hypothetical protein
MNIGLIFISLRFESTSELGTAPLMPSNDLSLSTIDLFVGLFGLIMVLEGAELLSISDRSLIYG